MIQMPTAPTKDYVFYTGREGARLFGEAFHKHLLDNLNLSWDEDLVRCAMQFALDDGATINIKQNQNKEIFVSVDGKTLHVGYELSEMILDIVAPILKQLRTRIHGPLKDAKIWRSNDLPGVTKIKIYKHKYPIHLVNNDTIWYAAKHKMSKDGGANHYVHGHIKSLKKDE